MSRSTFMQCVNARGALDVARKNCCHWDQESDGESGQECCYKVQDTKTEYRRALSAHRAAESGGAGK